MRAESKKLIDDLEVKIWSCDKDRAEKLADLVQDVLKIEKQADELIALKPEFKDSYVRQFECALGEIRKQAVRYVKL